MDMMSDHYEGSDLDQTEGVLSGPYGNPNRLEGGTGLMTTRVQLGRSISIPRTTTSLIAESFPNPKRSIAWLTLDAPSSAVYMPLYQSKDGLVGKKGFGEELGNGSREKVDRKSTWWAYNVVANQ